MTPEFKIEEGFWYISFDGGETWEKLGQATGDQGPQGSPGVGGDSMFMDVDYSSSDDYVILYLYNGMQIQIPTWSAFEALKEQCEQANANVEALQKIIDALDENDSVANVTPILENGVEVGYVIEFTKSGKITIYHGKDGADGADGTDGYTPVIGVRQDADGGYYWTLDGEWLLDENGNKVSASGKVNGGESEGEPGAPGEDGVTPLLKIEDDFWYVSYDNGQTWTKLDKSKGEDGKDGDSFFEDVDEDEQFVYFIMADGTRITLPKQISLAIEFDVDAVNSVVAMNPNSIRNIRYTVTSVLPDVHVEVLWSGDILAKVIPDPSGPSTGVIQVKAPGSNLDEYCKVVVLVANGEKVIMKTLVVEQEAIEVADKTEMEIPSDGGEVELSFMSNTLCEVNIPDEAQSWISIAPVTKALTRQSITLILAPNDQSVPRSAEVKVCGEEVSLAFTVTQDSDVEESIPEVVTLQKATKGNGIDIVLMGDAYVERQILDGTYREEMEFIYDNLFTEEPYASFKDCFNVYYVNVISENEGYGMWDTALQGTFGVGTYVEGNHEVVVEYAEKAIPNGNITETLIVVAMNSDAYAGTCHMFYPNPYLTKDYGTGLSIAYFPRGGDPETFKQLLHHEACGHGFAKLDDEYAYPGVMPYNNMNDRLNNRASWGWWKNVDFTDDPLRVAWAHFLEDERYANEGLGVFEGACTYEEGAWRPTENSIMRYNYGGFNAPSREAIYYRIHKLAYGKNWEYDYEDFVEYDAINRTPDAVAARTQRLNYIERNFEPTHPPVVREFWRDVE